MAVCPLTKMQNGQNRKISKGKLGVFETSTSRRILRGTTFRWVVPQLSPRIWENKQAWKVALLDRLQASKTARKGLRNYSIAVESHADGNPHLDLLLIFETRVRMSVVELDFLCDKHGDLTRYRNLTAGVLDYGSKEDKPLTNISDRAAILAAHEFKQDPYRVIQTQMLKDPFHFDIDDFCARHDYIAALPNYLSLSARLRREQHSVADQRLLQKRGLGFLTPQLIRSTLTPEQYTRFQSWPGYCTIVSAINSMVEYGAYRPFKSQQLLLVGRPNTGKTTLTRLLSEYVASYEMGVTNWFPRFRSGTYPVISWNQFNLNVLSYPNLLRFLEGTPMDVEYKGGCTLKSDNPLIILTSNLSFQTQLLRRYANASRINRFELVQAALENFPARVTELTLPPGHTLFFFQKLFRAASRG